MTKYSMKIQFEVEPYKTVEFAVVEAESKAQARDELRQWAELNPKLFDTSELSGRVNKKIYEKVL